MSYDLIHGEKWVREGNLALIQCMIPHELNTYDFDGVIYLNGAIPGVTPCHWDIIVTGRSFEEGDKVKARLKKRGIQNPVFLNPIRWADRNRSSSGMHKAKILRQLLENGFKIGCHFDDDEVQLEVINREVPEVQTVHLVHSLTPKDFRVKSHQIEGKWS